MQGLGECLRYEDNYVTVDPNVVDIFGIPVAKIHLTPRENEKAMLADMAETAAEMLEAAGARNIVPLPRRARQGARARRRAHGDRSEDLGPHAVPADARHPEPVRDGRLWLSERAPGRTRRSTIMALAVRSCDYVKEQLRRGDL